MITCQRCHHSKPEVDFTPRWWGSKLVSPVNCLACRAYLKDYNSRHKATFSSRNQGRKAAGLYTDRDRILRHEKHAQLQLLKDRPCAVCEKSFPWYVMDFDHRDPSQKGGYVGRMVKKLRWSSVLGEISKCDVVCVCCHRLRTFKGDLTSYKPGRRRIRVFLNELKTRTPCCDCNSFFQACQMDFDHVRGIKTSAVSEMLWMGKEAVRTEINKCDLVCANCHRVRTHNRKSSKQEIPHALAVGP